MLQVETVDEAVRVMHLTTPRSRALGYGTFVPLVDGLMIDSGFVRARRSLLRGLEGQTVSRVVNTHAHEDHFGNNDFLRETRGVSVLAPTASLPDMADPTRMEMRWYQHFVWGEPEATRPEPLGDIVETDRFRFRVIPTPGHSVDHVCLYEENRGWLFSGDLFLSVKVRLARPFENANDLLASLRRVRALEPRILFCYHCGVIHDADAQLGAKIEFMESIQAAVARERERGTEPAEIAVRLLGSDPLTMRVVTGGDFAKAHLVRAFLKDPGTGYETSAA